MLLRAACARRGDDKGRVGQAMLSLADALAGTEAAVLDVDAPFTSETEERLIALLGDRQRQKRWQLNLPALPRVEEALLRAVAEALRAEGLVVSHRSIVWGGRYGLPDSGKVGLLKRSRATS